MSTLDEQEELVRREDLLEALAKQDHRHPRGGWAPGEYMNKCIGCDTLFFGDKRAVECSDCAYAEEEEPVTQDVTKCDHGTQFYNPATNKCVRCLQADLTRLEDHYKRMHVYEEQCNALSQEYGKSLIAEGVPAIRAERDTLRARVKELKSEAIEVGEDCGTYMTETWKVDDALKAAEAEIERLEAEIAKVPGLTDAQIKNALEIGLQEQAAYDYATGLSTMQPINWKARAEKAEVTIAQREKEIYDLQPYKDDYQAVRSLCGLNKSDNSVSNFIDDLYGRAELAEDRLNWLLNHAMVAHLGANVYDIRVDTTWEKVGVEDPKFRELGLVECATILLDKVRAKAETKA